MDADNLRQSSHCNVRNTLNHVLLLAKPLPSDSLSWKQDIDTVLLYCSIADFRTGDAVPRARLDGHRETTSIRGCDAYDIYEGLMGPDSPCAKKLRKLLKTKDLVPSTARWPGAYEVWSNRNVFFVYFYDL